MTIARQQFGKHIPGVTLSTIEHAYLIIEDRVFRGVRAEEL
jgi:hypothetical protein